MILNRNLAYVHKFNYSFKCFFFDVANPENYGPIFIEAFKTKNERLGRISTICCDVKQTQTSTKQSLLQKHVAQTKNVFH